MGVLPMGGRPFFVWMIPGHHVQLRKRGQKTGIKTGWTATVLLSKSAIVFTCILQWKDIGFYIPDVCLSRNDKANQNNKLKEI
jgi:hypothetical protein